MLDLTQTLLLRIRRRLVAVAQRRVPSRLRGKIDPSDIVQASLLEACRNPRRIEGGESRWIAYLRVILDRNLIDQLRHFGRLKRHAGREQVLDPRSLESLESSKPLKGLEGVQPAQRLSPSQHVLRLESSEEVHAALDRLTDEQRQALVLRHWRGLALEQIAQEMGRTPVAVAGILRRGTLRLRELLGRGWR
jgi:RNA polymerase sigma-70 factor (ECF subfamily)